MGHVNRRPGNAVFAGWLGRAGGSSSPSGGLYHRRVIRRENPGHRLASRHLSQAILKELGKDVQIQFS